MEEGPSTEMWQSGTQSLGGQRHLVLDLGSWAWPHAYELCKLQQMTSRLSVSAPS